MEKFVTVKNRELSEIDQASHVYYDLSGEIDAKARYLYTII
jgi:hypothetical protein